MPVRDEHGLSWGSTLTWASACALLQSSCGCPPSPGPLLLLQLCLRCGRAQLAQPPHGPAVGAALTVLMFAWGATKSYISSSIVERGIVVLIVSMRQQLPHLLGYVRIARGNGGVSWLALLFAQRSRFHLPYSRIFSLWQRVACPAPGLFRCLRKQVGNRSAPAVCGDG